MNEKYSNNDIRISVEFLEQGKLLGDASSEIRRYELDLDVAQDLTCDAFLGALFAGIRSILTERYHLDVSECQSGIIFQDLIDLMEARPVDPQRGNLFLRPRSSQALRLRVSSMRYAAARKNPYNLDDFAIRNKVDDIDPHDQDRLDWQVCLQVFLECFYAYTRGYPEEQDLVNAQMLLSDQYRCHPAIISSTILAPPAANPLRMLSQAKDGSSTLRDLGFVNGSRMIFDPVLWHQSAALLEGKALAQQSADTPALRQLEPSQPEPYIIPTPGQMPERGRIDLAMVVLPSILLMLAVVVVWTLAGLTATPSNILMLALAMSIGTLLSACINRRIIDRSYDALLLNWRRGCEQLIRKSLQDLRTAQAADIRFLENAFLPAQAANDQDLLHRAVCPTAPVQDRRPGSKDFLKVRLGLSAKDSKLVPFSRSIQIAPMNEDWRQLRFRNLLNEGNSHFALELPGTVTQALPGNESYQGTMDELALKLNTIYGFLEQAPVILDLEHLQALGLVSMNGQDFQPFVTNLILDLCCHQRPEDLQLLILFPPSQDRREQSQQIHRFKALPHFRGLFPDRASFAFSREDAWQIFDRLHRLCLDRQQSGIDIPHVVLFVLHDYDFKSHPLSGWLEEDFRRSGIGAGLTVVLSAGTRFDLPVYCPTMIRADSEKNWYLVPLNLLHRADITGEFVDFSRYQFRPDAVSAAAADLSRNRDTEPYYLAFRALGARYHGVEQHPLPPTYLELFRLIRNPATGMTAGDVSDTASSKRDTELAYLLQRHLKDVIDSNWRTPCCIDLQVPIGRGPEEEVCLDLQKGKDGAHLLIAGDSQSGKTAAALTLLLQLCIRFNPEALKLCLVDLGGHTLLKPLEGIPHILHGLRLDSQNIQTIRTQMRTLLDSLLMQLHQRQIALLAEDCESIDAYNRKMQFSKSGKPMSHLFLVIDNYDLLSSILQGSPTEADRMDLGSELTKLLRTAENAGLHLVLLSKDPHISLSDALWSNLRTRLCLKVSDPQLSHRLIGTGAASRIRLPGRAFLVRQNSTYPTPLQLAYSGSDIAARKGFPFRIDLAEPGGPLVPFFDSATYPHPGTDDRIYLYTRYDPDCGSDVERLLRHQSRSSEKQEASSDGSTATPDAKPGTQNGQADPHTPDPRPGSSSDDSSSSRRTDARPHTGRSSGTADPRPDWWYAQQGRRRAKGDPEPAAARPSRTADPRPDWWYAQQGRRRAKGGPEPAAARPSRTADPRPDWWYAQQGRRRAKGDPEPTAARPSRTADPRPDWWYAQQGRRRAKGDPEPAAARPSGTADPRPDWWYAQQNKKSARSGDTIHDAYTDDYSWEKKKPDYEGKRYAFGDIRWKRKPKHRTEDRAERYFRPPVAAKTPRRVVLPRPDLAVCERKPVGITQAQCLAEMLRTTRAAPKPQTELTPVS